MSKFIRTIGRCRWNGIGFGIYENADGTATIRPEKLGQDLPRKKWVNFNSLKNLDGFIDSIDKEGVDLVVELQERILRA